MLTHDQARRLVQLRIAPFNVGRQGLHELIIVDEYTVERPWGWVFHYTSRGWHAGDLNYGLGGNAPYIVNRFDGTIHGTGTARSTEYYIAEYESELERKQGAWELMINEPADCPLDVLSGIRKALALSVFEIGILKKRLPYVYRAGARVDLEPLLSRLVSAGVSAELRQSTALR